MLKPLTGIAILFTLSSAAAQAPAAAPESNAPGKVVRVIGARPTPTGESPRVFAAKRRMLSGSLAQNCGINSVYFSLDDDETYLDQLAEGQPPAIGETGESGTSMRSPNPQKFSGNAPDGDASTVVDSSVLTGTPSRYVLGPCEGIDRRFASGREHILRKDRSFADALVHLDAKEYGKAAAMLDVAYDKIGYPEAAVLLAELSLVGLGVPRNTEKALYWLDRAAGARFDPRDKLRFNPRRPTASTGMIDAALLLARLHLQGVKGIKKDPAVARKWYRKAADFGYVPALDTLGLAARDGIGGPKDLKQARTWFQKAAEAGYVPAQFNLAALYYDGGDGVARDYALAGAWFAQAGKAGHARALYAMARMYDLGQGVPANQARAIVYYKEAALKLVPEAQGALASYFYTGEQVPKNLVTARRLFNEAATRGEPEAMFNLAAMLAAGEGGEKDPGMAYVWLSLAKTSGLERAGPALALIDGQLSSLDRARADLVLKTPAGR